MSKSQNDNIRVVVCGDEGVGKSSLITSLVKDTFVPNIQSVLPPVTIPRQFSSLADTPGQTIVVDTSPLLQDRPQLTKEIRRANVIWLVYSDHYTCERISLFWMPFFRSLGVNLPVVLTANKCDLSPRDEASRAISEEMIPILKEFKEVESCIRCSASLHFNVNQAFYLCQRAVTHPLAPLFDSKEGKLKPAAVAALERVFFLADSDQDGCLNDTELKDLQAHCFQNKSLEEVDILQLKNILSELSAEAHVTANTGDSESNGLSIVPAVIPGKGITCEGFILLNKIFAEKGRHETTWGILRRFHYTDSLSLEDKFLYPKLDVPPNASVELSPDGYRFLVDMFLLFDKDNDGGLNQLELNALFKPTPGIPKLWKDTNFPQSTVRNEAGNVTLQGWLAQWSMTTYLDYRSTMAYLAQLGFDGKQGTQKITDGVKITKPRKKRNPASKAYRSTAITDRNVFNCFVLGSSGSGKTTLLKAFLNRPFSEVYTPTIQPISVVNSVEMPGGKQCYLILEELGELEPAVLENSSRLDECDVICFTYDSSDPDSFAYLVNLHNTYPQLNMLPAVYVALKADLDRQQQRCEQQPDVYTRNLSMAAPLHVSAQWTSSLNELFVQLAEAAEYPGSATPRDGPEEHDTSMLPTAATVGSALGVLAISLWLWRSQQR
ncbi:ERMES complex Ca(2+)-binding regulatory GTPase GEM1 [Sugiyamaella lignohabitans]|uniref:Mitochondrial Rho GTPase n=1 Tax=Sugiyamaella lignohabitans TaxID=796027 RepID=A0A161HJN2_9ASCO|nr:ERMES complex Ca(2+)-binding regulatory GTPase GEM1 [Sugiyamaella lignohabitans]ANB12947.1 ERMES complex Ca(2+)-binding regulatory GTPase GEM1 [Sugiyamaella lignohabitans]